MFYMFIEIVYRKRVRPIPMVLNSTELSSAREDTVPGHVCSRVFVFLVLVCFQNGGGRTIHDMKMENEDLRRFLKFCEKRGVFRIGGVLPRIEPGKEILVQVEPGELPPMVVGERGARKGHFECHAWRGEYHIGIDVHREKNDVGYS